MSVTGLAWGVAAVFFLIASWISFARGERDQDFYYFSLLFHIWMAVALITGD